METIDGKNAPEDNGVDPKLKELVEKLKPLLAEYDVAASIFLCSTRGAEFYSHIVQPPAGPTWSCLYAEGNNVRLRAAAASIPAERFRLVRTAKMIGGFRDLHLREFAAYDRMFDRLVDQKITDDVPNYDPRAVKITPHEPEKTT